MPFKRLVLPLFALLLVPGIAAAHCQIPCGIFDDEARFTIMLEDVTTIEKSMKEIERLAGEDSSNWNQIVRWVNNKETHADKLADTVTHYFMAQRVKPAPHGDKEAMAIYVERLTLLHSILVHAMKAKQSTDLGEVEVLRSLIGKFKTAYVSGHAH